TVGEFAQAVRRAVLMVDTASAEQRHEMARKDRRVAFLPTSEGMSEMYWLLPTDQAAAVKVRIDALAARCEPGDERTSDQRRSDALYDVISSHETSASAETREHGTRPTVLVTMSVATAAGASDAPGELAGFGPIPAFLARRIAYDPTGTWRRMLTDERGPLVEYGRTTYRPPADLARFVIARNRTCCFPGCSRAAARCELDHCRDWADDGTTDATNLYALCPRHHHLKHEAGWRYEPLPDGDLLWTSRTGHRYRRAARVYPDETYLTDPARRRRPVGDARNESAAPDEPPF
ncbi:MAG TPA: DUF222 domain-containing protein, partial [Jatrophihabitantaceae bacterium]|nr:DUF222 domain-containing protein [Jatrophihabitantaceae bacterium]